MQKQHCTSPKERHGSASAFGAVLLQLDLKSRQRELWKIQILGHFGIQEASSFASIPHVDNILRGTERHVSLLPLLFLVISDTNVRVRGGRRRTGTRLQAPNLCHVGETSAWEIHVPKTLMPATFSPPSLHPPWWMRSRMKGPILRNTPSFSIQTLGLLCFKDFKGTVHPKIKHAYCSSSIWIIAQYSRRG